MKKSTARNIILTCVMTASLGSYIYLNTVASSSLDEANTSVKLELQPQSMQEEIEEQSRLQLPDVMIIKKAIEIGKKFIPAS